MRRLAILAALLPFALCGAAGCPPGPLPPSPDADAAPQPVVEAGPSPLLDAAPYVDATPATDACARGEAQLLALGCKDSRGRLLGGPTMKGVAWAQVCRNNAINGIDMRPDCIATKRSCTEVNASCR